MERREFLGGLAAAAWLLQVCAAGRPCGIGILMGIAETDPSQKALLAALRQGLQSLGWNEDQNVRINTRWGAGDAERIRNFAQELVASHPDLIVGHTTPVVAALLQQTRSIPIVFAQMSDPIGSGFVASLAHPGGNATGFTNLEASMSAKLIGLLKEVVPAAWVPCSIRIQHLTAARTMRPAEVAAGTLQIEVVAAPVHTGGDRRRRITLSVSEWRPAVMPDVFMLAHRSDPRLPAAIACPRLMLIGVLGKRRPVVLRTDLVDLLGRTAPCADRILKGATPAELPVQHHRPSW